ncbi:MAG: hypothetical protein OEW75_04100 [Cyclobacteriaceae bacterium]|nr:hypothetical protein [Cyclobacteriaceae bacterium]
MMRFYGYMLITVVLLAVASCSILKSDESGRIRKKDLTAYVNSPAIYYVLELEVTNDSFFQVLDVALSEFAKCKFYKEELSNLYGFRILNQKIEGKSTDTYWIFGRRSINMALGTLFVEAGLETKEEFSEQTGAFYYQNKLFVVSTGREIDSEKYPFLRATGCKLRVVGSDLGASNLYYSELEFVNTQKGFEVTEIDLCNNVRMGH